MLAKNYDPIANPKECIRDDELAQFIRQQILLNGGVVKDVKFIAQCCFGGGLLDDLGKVFEPGGGCVMPWVGGAAAQWGEEDADYDGWWRDPVDNAEVIGCAYTTFLANRKRDANGSSRGTIQPGHKVSDDLASARDVDVADQDQNQNRELDRWRPGERLREHPLVCSGNGGSNTKWRSAPGEKHHVVMLSGEQRARDNENIANMTEALTAAFGADQQSFVIAKGATRQQMLDAIAAACIGLDANTQLVVYVGGHGFFQVDFAELLSWALPHLIQAVELLNWQMPAGWTAAFLQSAASCNIPTPVLRLSLADTILASEWGIRCNGTPVALPPGTLSGDVEVPLDWTTLQSGANSIEIEPVGSGSMTLAGLVLDSGPLGEVPARCPAPALAYSASEAQIRVCFDTPVTGASAENTGNYALSTLEPIVSAVYDGSVQAVTLTTATPLVPALTPHVLSVSGLVSDQGVPMDGTKTARFVGGVCGIPFVQTPRSAADDTSRLVGLRVTVRGVITATSGADFPASLGGFYMQQRGVTQYGGVFVSGPVRDFNWPLFPPLGRADSVIVSGLVSEFGSGPETRITSVTLCNLLGPRLRAIPPLATTVADVDGTDAARARALQSMLVRVTGVTTDSTRAVGASFDAIAGDGHRVRVGNLALQLGGVNVFAGSVYDISGIVRVASGRRLEPRDWREPPKGEIHLVSSPVSDAAPVVYRTELLQSQPNPFNPTTEIGFTLAQAGHLRLCVYDVGGRLVASLFDGPALAGPHRVMWDGRTGRGDRVPSGIYLYRLSGPGVAQTRKMALLR